MTLKCGSCWSSWRVVSSPFRLGIPMSTMTTSGFSCNAFSTASRPSLASPQTSQPSCFSSKARKPRRTISWSSANKILNFIIALSRAKWVENLRQFRDCAAVQGGKDPVLTYSFDSGKQIPRGIGFHHIATRARIQRFPHHLGGVMLGDEQNLQACGLALQQPTGLQSVHFVHGHVQD